MALLLKHKVCDRRYLNATSLDEDLNRPLHVAVKNKHLSMVGTLLGAKADP